MPTNPQNEERFPVFGRCICVRDINYWYQGDQSTNFDHICPFDFVRYFHSAKQLINYSSSPVSS